MNTSIFIYPWDIIDEGINKVLDTLVDIGFKSLSVTTSYHAGKFLRPHCPKGKLYYPEDGVIYFKPDDSLYRKDGVRPIISSLVGKDNLFSYLPEMAKKRGLNIIAWVVCLHNTRLGTAYPGLVTQNCFGDRNYNNLCPNKRGVKEYIEDLVKDIFKNYDFDAVELETPGFLKFEHGFHHEMYGFQLDFLSAFFLSLCFCKDCLSIAEEYRINGRSVCKIVKDELNDFFSADAPDNQDLNKSLRLIHVLLENEDVYKFLQFRNKTVFKFVKDIKKNVPKDKELYVIPSISNPCYTSWIEGGDISMLSSIADGIEILSYYRDSKVLKKDIRSAKKMIKDKCKFRVALRPYYPDISDMDELIQKMQIINELGVDGCSFYNYGHMRSENLKWIKKALTEFRGK